jgi:hypothetical protein
MMLNKGAYGEQRILSRPSIAFDDDGPSHARNESSIPVLPELSGMVVVGALEWAL